MIDFDDLGRYLHARADAAELRHTPVSAITRAGARRRARRRTAATAGAVTVGALAAGITVQGLGRGSTPRSVGTETLDVDRGTSPPTTTGAPTTATPTTASTPTSDVAATQSLVDSPLVWNPITVGSAEAITSFGAVGDPVAAARRADGSLFQVSSAPGRRTEIAPMAYTSADGVHWMPDESAVFDGRLTPLAVDGDHLYTVSTGAATAAPIGSDKQYFAVTSDDGGATWMTELLDLDTAAWAAEPGIRSGGFHSRAGAVSGADVVVGGIATVAVEPYTYAARLGLDIATLGMDPATGEVVARVATPIDCADLGPLHEEAERAADGGFVHPPGTRLEDGRCVAWGDETGRYDVTDLGLPPEAVAASSGLPVLFHSAGGSPLARTEAPALPEGYAAHGMRVVGGPDGFALVLTGYRRAAGGEETRAFAYSSPNGRQWSPLPDLPGSDCGVTLIGFVGDVLALDTRTCTGGAVILTLRDGAWTTSSPTALLAPSDGSPRFVLSAIGDRGVAAVVGVAPPRGDTDPFDPSAMTWTLLFSTDGVTWSRTDLADITDMTGRRVTAVRVTDAGVLVSVAPRTDGGSETPLPDVTVLVGTMA